MPTTRKTIAVVLAVGAVASVAPAAASAGVLTTQQNRLVYTDPDHISSNLTIERLELTNATAGFSRYRVRETGTGVTLRLGGSCFPSGSNEAICHDVTGQEVVLGGGNDLVFMRDLAPSTHGDPAFGRIFGGPGNDAINTAEGVQHVNGEDGDDAVDAGAGADFVYGGSGTDLLAYSSRLQPVTVGGHATLIGESNEKDSWQHDFETLTGGAAADTLAVAGRTIAAAPRRLVGNGGNDLLIGGAESTFRADAGDVLEGRAGDDHLYARDGLRDFLLCGDGTGDLASADLTDSVGSSCEAVDRAPVTAGPNVQIAGKVRVSDGKALVRLTCPRSSRVAGQLDTRSRPCAGTLRLGAGKAAFRVAVGRSARVTVPLRGSAPKRAVATERIHPKGPNTTIRPVRLAK